MVLQLDDDGCAGGRHHRCHDARAALDHRHDDLLAAGRFLGFIPGSFGETSTLAILIGAAILLFTGIASWRTMVSVFVGGLAMGYLFQALGVTEYPAWWHLIVGASPSVRLHGHGP